MDAPEAAGAESAPAEAYARFHQHTVTVGDHRLHVVDEGSGPPVILLHGSPVSSFSFRHQIAALAKHFRMIAPDLPGFGQSSAPAEGADFSQQVGALRGFIEALDLDSFDLVGHDWGGPIGLAAVAGRAEAVRRLVLINTTLRPDFEPPPYWKPFTTPGLGELLLVRWNAFGRHLPVMLQAAHTEEVGERYARALRREGTRRTVLALERLEGYAAAAEAFARSIAALRADVLIVWGRPDVYFRQRELDYLVRTFPAAQVHEVPQGGHFPQEDKPEAVTAALEAFLREGASLR